MDYNNAEAIFIPSDIEGDKTNYTQYKVGFYRSVPQNCVLVRRNRFTKKLYTVNEIDSRHPDEYDDNGKIKKYGQFKTGGFHLMPPFITESIFVPVIDRTIDYPKAEYYTEDGIAANVDIALKVRIVDPENYLKFGKHQLDQLNVLTQNLLIEYIKNKNFHELSSGRINLDEFDKPTPGQNGGVKEGAYKDFAKRYGIEVKSVQLKSIKLPEKLQKLYDDKIEEEKKREAQEVRLKAETQRVEAEANMAAIRGRGAAEEYKLMEQAKIDMSIKELKQIQSILSTDSMSDSEKVDMMKTVFAAKNGTYLHFGGMNGNSTNANIAQGIVAGNVASEKIKEKANEKKLSNSERLLQQIDLLINTGLEPDEYLKDLQKSIKPGGNLKSRVDALSETDYKNFADQILSAYGVKPKSRNR